MGNFLNSILYLIKRQKNAVIIICASLAVLAGVFCGFLTLKAAKQAVPAAADVSSEQASSSSSEAIIPVSSEQKVDNGIRLVITSPERAQVSTTESFIKIAGTSDPAEPLTMNGQALERGTDGWFSIDVDLKVGKNTFNFEHKGEQKVITVNYRFVVINAYSPSGAQVFSSGSSFAVTVAARSGSKVSAVFNGQTIALTEDPKTAWQDAQGSAFNNFTGSFQIPVTAVDRNLGKIKYTATYNGVTETFYSGNITCKRSEIVTDYDPSTPITGRYMQVGAGYIAEIVAFTAETFDGNTVDDASRPTNNYLPQGTVDYCSTGYTYYTDPKGTQKRYTTLRCGRRVYTEKKDDVGGGVSTVTKQYLGTLPDHNEVAVASVDQSGRHTVLAFDVMWKAPFYFDLLQQSYTNPAKQDYTISAPTYKYIDITFCYATEFTGEVVIDENNPVFKSAEIIRNQYDCTLRLHLKKLGSFYGWDCRYNEAGQLVFEFLHPAKVTAGRLDGAKILIDVGHGGIDPGAVGAGNYYESRANLNLAFKLKAELEELGATVVMTREGDSTLVADQRIQRLKAEKPDYCIAIHHDSSASAAANGFSTYYSTPFSMKATEFVLNRTSATGIYSNYKIGWHYFYLARSTVCPVVLTENGYMSNANDLAKIKNDSINADKARTIAQGVVDYFNSIQ